MSESSHLQAKAAISKRKRLSKEDKSVGSLVKVGWFIWNFLVVGIYLSFTTVTVFAIYEPGQTIDGIPALTRYPLFFIMILAGLTFGWIMHRAFMLKVIKVTGVRFIDAGILAWFMGFTFAIPPLILVDAFNPDLFDDTPTGHKLITWLNWAARICLLLLFFDAFILWSISSSIPQNGP